MVKGYIPAFSIRAGTFRCWRGGNPRTGDGIARSFWNMFLRFYPPSGAEGRLSSGNLLWTPVDIMFSLT
ncbi:hypothetical protein HMPREF1326_02883 [Akkermansia sp. KLE1605]|nr:hypothetical protein HMPREF1326_02883 [Akkermansia sp. KLE1605]